ncbi:peptide/nickel transport system ATP-binding protein [Devosia enhydra]|uniref:Nickel import system ATP-binding protein NikD n=1 Tax=Devosia enhydra TaxID=665118 RepID=A0A1K2I1M2_9HYPH|nr:ATP-binding cassette domain-containing protein [Devosia enhydra]SFZ86277.1 peptide/nickel transport system ATP-binding protein [Devosia enhydra]
MLAIEALTVGFRRYRGLLAQVDVRALGPLEIGLARGEVLALVGASGAGKSLLAHALFGVLPPNALVSGRMLFDGIALEAQTLPALRGRKMGLVPQSISHLDPLVRCGRQLGWAARRAGRPVDRSGLEAALGWFDLDASVLDAFPHALSGGMARRLMLAMAIIGGPDLVVADEPISGLDADNAALVLGYFRRLADEGRAVLLITHDLVQAIPVSDRVAILRDGHLEGIAPAAAFSGDGSALASPYARALWRAMPENGFGLEPVDA